MNPTTYISLVSFPGFGIGEFPVNRLAFRVFGMDIMWYGVIICFGILAAFTYFAWRANGAGINFDNVLDYTLFTVPIGVLGARLYYVLFSLSDHSYSSIWDVLNPRDGGLAIYGGIIFGALTVFFVSRHKKHSFLLITDCLVPGVMIAQAIGRWGNFMNVEAFGGETTLPWRMGIRKLGMSQIAYVHPTFLYESLWNVIGFVLINIFYKKKKYNGQIFLAYLGWYGLGRMFIEGLRSDSLWLIPGKIRVSQLLAFVLFVASAILYVILNCRRKKLVRDGALTENSVADTAVLFGFRKPEPRLADTGEVDFNTEEFERLNAIEDSEAKRKAMEKNPFVPTSEFDAVKEEDSPAAASDETEPDKDGEVPEENDEE